MQSVHFCRYDRKFCGRIISSSKLHRLDWQEPKYISCNLRGWRWKTNFIEIPALVSEMKPGSRWTDIPRHNKIILFASIPRHLLQYRFFHRTDTTSCRLSARTHHPPPTRPITHDSFHINELRDGFLTCLLPHPNADILYRVNAKLWWRVVFYGIKCIGTAADRIRQVLKAGVIRVRANIKIQNARTEEMPHGYLQSTVRETYRLRPLLFWVTTYQSTSSIAA
jgi:hypothetical protein